MAKKQQSIYEIKIKGLEDLKSLNKEVQNLNKKYDGLKKGSEGASKSTKGVGDSAKGSALGLGKLAKGAAAAGAALIAFNKISKILSNQLKEGIQVFKGFEFEMAKVKAISGATDTEFNKLSNTAQELGRSTFFTAKQVASLQLNFSKLGFTASEVLQTQEAALLTATATGEDLARTATVIGSTIRGFGLDARESSRVADVMAASFTSSALTLEKFQTSMTKVSPVAKLLGIDLEETTAIMGVLTDAGIEASIAGTSLRNIFLKLGDPSSDLAKSIGFTVNSGEDMVREFRRMRDEGINVEKMLKVVDVRQVAAISTMIEHIDKIELQTEAFRKSEGAAGDMADIIGNTLEGAFLRFQSALDGVRIVLVEKLAPALTSIVDTAATFLNIFAKSVDPADDFTKSLAQQFDEIKKTDEAIAVSIEKYDMLAKKQNLSEKEMSEMNTELNKLSNLFGVNVTAINNETGALELNRDELIKQLRLRKALQSETAIDLLAQRQDMEALAKTNAELEKTMRALFQSAEGTLTDEQRKSVESIAGSLENVSTLLDSGLLRDERFSELQAVFINLVMSSTTFNEALGIQQKLFKGVDEDGTSAAQALAALDAELEKLGIDIVEIDNLFGKSALGKPKEGSTSTISDEPTGDFESIADSAELRLQGLILKAKKEFFASEVETKEDFSLRLLGIEINLLEDTLELLKDGSEDKFEIDKKLTDARIKLKEQETNIFLKSEEEKEKSAKKTIATMKKTGKLLMQIGEQEGENSKIRQLGIKITQAAAVAEGIHGLTKSFHAIANQGLGGDPLTAIIRVAAMASQLASVIANLKALTGSGGGGEPAQSSFESDLETFSHGGLTKGGVFVGNSHANGGVKFAVGGRVMEAEGGEAIINKKSTKMFRPMLSAINSYNGNGVKFADGGLLNSGEKFALGGQLMSAQQLVSGGSSAANVLIVESDVTDVQSRISTIESQASF
tara:strand:+ start:11928 stop:14819 length:2892 start_codon:yes stop_codon:yes gene_type:complete